MVQTLPLRRFRHSNPLALPYTFVSSEHTLVAPTPQVPLAAPSNGAHITVGFIALSTDDNSADEVRIYFDDFSTEIDISWWGSHRSSPTPLDFLRNPIAAPTENYALLIENTTVATTVKVWLTLGYLYVTD
jgi:hypothetical protein